MLNLSFKWFIAQREGPVVLCQPRNNIEPSFIARNNLA